MSERMLQAFIVYERNHRPAVVGATSNIVGLPLGTRLKRIVRIDNGWRLWTATADYLFGTYLCVMNDGQVTSTTVREDEGDETFVVRPTDDDIGRGEAARSVDANDASPNVDTNGATKQ